MTRPGGPGLGQTAGMAHPRRFRFAAELHAPLPGRTWLDSAREIEQLGYSTVFLPDHWPPSPP